MNSQLISRGLNEYDRSAFAEEYFSDKLVPVITGDGSSQPADYRDANIEGEFLVGEDLYEVKSDWGNAIHTGNLVVEIAHNAFADNRGWFQHCVENGVDFLVWLCYRSTNDQHHYYPEPYCAVKVPVKDISILLMQDDMDCCLKHRQFENTEIVLVPISVLASECQARIYINSLETDVFGERAMRLIGNYLQYVDFVEQLKAAV